MDDETLAPFVDALASALIMMVLVAVFFLLQSMSAITESAKLFTVASNAAVNDGKAYTPVTFRRPLKVDLEAGELVYLVNFELTEAEVQSIRQSMLEKNTLTLTVFSDDKEKKSVVNLLRLLKLLQLPPNVKVQTVLQSAQSPISKITWK